MKEDLLAALQKLFFELSKLNLELKVPDLKDSDFTLKLKPAFNFNLATFNFLFQGLSKSCAAPTRNIVAFCGLDDSNYYHRFKFYLIANDSVTLKPQMTCEVSLDPIEDRMFTVSIRLIDHRNNLDGIRSTLYRLYERIKPLLSTSTFNEVVKLEAYSASLNLAQRDLRSINPSLTIASSVGDSLIFEVLDTSADFKRLLSARIHSDLSYTTKDR